MENTVTGISPQTEIQLNGTMAAITRLKENSLKCTIECVPATLSSDPYTLLRLLCHHTHTHTHTHSFPQACRCLNIPQNSLTVAALLLGNDRYVEVASASFYFPAAALYFTRRKLGSPFINSSITVQCIHSSSFHSSHSDF